MAFVLNDRVKETTTTTGTGTINLGGAATGFETFVAGIGNSNVTYYCIAGQGTAEFEVGIGTVTDASPDTLSRTTILSSSNSDSAVNFSAGTKDVFCTLPAGRTIREVDTALNVPTGTTAQRAGSPAAGDFRYNTTTGRFEGYLGSAWGSFGSSNSFFTNIFAGDGSDTTFTLSQTIDNENDLLVFIDGVFQAQNVYSVSGTTLTFATAPANGRVITVYSVKAGVSGSNYTLSTMTGDGSDTTLTLNTDPVNENNVQVYIDGTYQNKDTFSVSGTTLTFSEAPPNNTKVEAIVATQTTINTATQLLDADGDTKVMVEESSDEDKIRFDTGGTERMIVDDSGNVGIGATSSNAKVTLQAADNDTVNAAANGHLTFSDDAPVEYYKIRIATTNRDLFFEGYDTDSAWKEILRLDRVDQRINAKGGILFGSDTASANALDDYEEGTWTPTDASGASLSFSSLDRNRYTKIGRFVMAHCRLDYPSTSDGSVATIALPFTPSNDCTASTTGGVMTEQNYSTSVALTASIDSTTGARIRSNGNAALTNANLSGKSLRFTVTFITD